MAQTLDAVQLDFACHMLAGAAERLGPELVARFGGETLFDPREDMAGEPEGTTLPLAPAATSKAYSSSSRARSVSP